MGIEKANGNEVGCGDKRVPVQLSNNNNVRSPSTITHNA